MFLKFSLLLLGLSVSLATARRLKISVQTSTKVQDLRGESLLLAESHSDLSKSCFDYYNPQLATILAIYENTYNGCIDNYEEHKNLVNEGYKEARVQLQQSYSKACYTLKCCNETTTSYNAFKCASLKVSTIRSYHTMCDSVQYYIYLAGL